MHVDDEYVRAQLVNRSRKDEDCVQLSAIQSNMFSNASFSALFVSAVIIYLFKAIFNPPSILVVPPTTGLR